MIAQLGLRRVRQRPRVRAPAVRDRRDPRARREHRVQRVPEPLVDHRQGRLPARVSSRTAATGSCSRTASSCSRPRPPCLLVAFGGITNALIPLYAVGVFTSFTLSQCGHGAPPPAAARAGLAAQRRAQRGRRGRDARRAAHRRDHEVHERRVGADRRDPADRAAVQGDQASLHARRRGAARPADYQPPRRRHTVVVLVGGVHRGVLEALAYARVDRARPPARGDGRRRRPRTPSGSRSSGRSTASTCRSRSCDRPTGDFTAADAALHRRARQRRWENDIVTVLIPELFVRALVGSTCCTTRAR